MRRRFATFALMLIGCLALGGVLAAQDQLPLRPDDMEYAKKLAGAGFQDLAADIYERLYTDATGAQKLALAQQMAEAYRSMARGPVDAATRDKYLARAAELLKLVTDAGNVKPEVRYDQAVLAQTKGLGLTRDVKAENNPEKKKALIAEAAKLFDECAATLDFVAKDQNAKADDAGKKFVPPADMDKMTIEDKRAEAGKLFRDMAIKCEHQRAWTIYYKAQLWGADEQDFKTTMGEAVNAFKAFAVAHPTEMLMLSARYGCGLAYKQLDKKPEALKEFSEIITTIEDHGSPTEVLPLKARCAYPAAELLADDGKFDDAVKMLDKELKENTAVEPDKDLKSLGLVTKAKVLGIKAERNKDDKVWDEYFIVLSQATATGGNAAGEVPKLIAQGMKTSGKTNLPASATLTLIESYIGEKKYKNAIDEARPNVDKPPADTLVAFKIHRDLGLSYLLSNDFKNAITEFESVFRLYTTKVPKDEMAKAMDLWCKTLGTVAAKDKTADNIKRSKEAWKRLAMEYPDTTEGQNAMYYLAQSIAQQAAPNSVKDWTEARDAYDQVKPEATNYAKSQYLSAQCSFNVYKILAAGGKKDTPDAQNALKSAVDRLKALFDKLPPPKAGEDWPGEASKILVDVYLDLGQLKDAEDSVNQTMKRFPDLLKTNPKFASTVVALYIKLNRIEDAVKLLTGISEGADPMVLVRAYLQIGDIYMKQGDEAKAANKLQEMNDAYKRAGEFFGKAIDLLPQDQRDTFKLDNAIANRAFLVNDYAVCIRTILKIEEFYKANSVKEDNNLWGKRLLQAKCYRQLNQWPPEALELLKKLTEHFPGNADLRVLNATVLENQGKWAPALEEWNGMDGGFQAGTPDWWDVKFHRALCYFKTGDKARAKEIVDGLRVTDPKFKTPDIKDRFDKLYQEITK